MSVLLTAKVPPTIGAYMIHTKGASHTSHHSESDYNGLRLRLRGLRVISIKWGGRSRNLTFEACGLRVRQGSGSSSNLTERGPTEEAIWSSASTVGVLGVAVEFVCGFEWYLVLVAVEAFYVDG